MKTDFQKGLAVGLAIYLTGIALTAIAHLILGWDNAHAPPSSFLVIVLLLIAGFIRMLINARNISTNRERAKNKGEVIIHVAVFIMVIAFISWLNLGY